MELKFTRFGKTWRRCEGSMPIHSARGTIMFLQRWAEGSEGSGFRGFYGFRVEGRVRLRAGRSFCVCLL